MTHRPISELSPARSSAAPLFSAFPLRFSAHSAPPCPTLRGVRYLFFFHCLSALRGAFSFFSGLSSPNCQISAENAKSTNITLRLSIILINNVGAPTFLIIITKPQNLPASEGGRYKNSKRLLSLFSYSPPATRHSSLSLIIPVHPRHSPVSPIIPVHTQKQGGGGVSRKMCSPLTPLFSLAIVTLWLSI